MHQRGGGGAGEESLHTKLQRELPGLRRGTSTAAIPNEENKRTPL